MKIDILFLDNDLNSHEEYFDNEMIKEYCETHSFEGKKNYCYQNEKKEGLP